MRKRLLNIIRCFFAVGRWIFAIFSVSVFATGMLSGFVLAVFEFTPSDVGFLTGALVVILLLIYGTVLFGYLLGSDRKKKDGDK